MFDLLSAYLTHGGRMSLFEPGRLTSILDGGAGSSGKGLRAANIWKHHRASHTTFAVNTFMENAAHTVFHEDGTEHIYQCLSSITALGSYEKQYLSPGCAFAADTILREIKKYKLTPTQLGIHPNAIIVTKKDVDYEAGRCDFEGNPKPSPDSANLKIGSTLHGVGAARARRVLRRDDVVLAKDVEALKPFLCDTNVEIMHRLSKKQSGLMEIAQGYQLSLMSQFYPRTTSRNCSIAAALDDSLLPPIVAGPVVINFRTYPIRVNNNKYIRRSDAKILTWDEYNTTPESDRYLIQGDSGAGYNDQVELTWESVSERAGKQIFEKTSLTKLPRRVFTFSRQNLMAAMVYNNTGHDMYISINFMNYVDADIEGKRTIHEVMTNKVKNWLSSNVITDNTTDISYQYNIHIGGLFIGTYRTIDDSIYIDDNNHTMWS